MIGDLYISKMDEESGEMEPESLDPIKANLLTDKRECLLAQTEGQPALKMLWGYIANFQEEQIIVRGSVVIGYGLTNWQEWRFIPNLT